MAAVRQLLSPPGIGMTGRSWLLGAILRPTRSCPNLPRHGLTQQTPAAAAPTRLGSCSELCAPVLQELHPDPSLCSTRVELGPRRGRVAAAPRPLGFWSCRDRRTEDAARLCLVTGTCSHIHRENKASSVEPAASAYRHPAACFCHLAMSGCICARAVAGFPAMPAQDCFQLQMGAEEPGNRDYGANFCIFPLILASSPHHTSSEETPWKQAANAMCVMSQ